MKYRYLHFSEVCTGIPTEFQQFMKINQPQQQMSSDTANLDYEEVKKILSNFPQYENILDKYKRHIQFCHDCFDMVKQK